MDWNFQSRPVSSREGLLHRHWQPKRTASSDSSPDDHIAFRKSREYSAVIQTTPKACFLVTLASYSIFLGILIHIVRLTFLECLLNFLHLMPLFPMLHCVFSRKFSPDSETLQFDENTKAVNSYLFFLKDTCKGKLKLRPLSPLFLLAYLFAFVSPWSLFVLP